MFVLFLIHILFYFSAVGSATIDSGKDFCANPVPSENPVDLKWLHEHFEEGWNIQFGHPEERKQFAQFVNGFGEAEDDYSQMCARMKLDFVDSHFSGQFNGYGGKVSPFSCTSDFLCNITSSDKTTAVQVQAHVSYFDRTADDKHNMAAIIQCPPTGEGEALYKVITISKTISEEETKIITEHLRSIGLDPENRVSFRSQNCP